MRRAANFLLAVAISVGALAQIVHGQEVLDIRRYAQEGVGSVNSYIVETRNGVVLIDGQRVLSQGTAVADRVSETGKPLLAVLITHPHPDHFGGLAAVLARYPDTPVYSSEATLDEMRTDGHGFMAATREAVPNDTPDTIPLPSHTFAAGQTLVFDGVEFIVDEIGAGEAEAMSMFYVPDANALFVGDLVCHRMTPFLLEGRLQQWLDQLRTIRSEYAETTPTIVPGHGMPGPYASLLDWQRDYLSELDQRVRDARNDGAVSEEEIMAIIAEMNALYPDHHPVAAMPNLLELNVRLLTGKR
jgi:glyoxylase-like metal-dependent hydrolase (beta-lactamase superfamily II)